MIALDSRVNVDVDSTQDKRGYSNLSAAMASMTR